MARLPYLDRSDLQPEFQELLARNINLHRLLVHSPVATRAWHQFAHFIRHESQLDPRLRELAILQVGYLERSAYEYSHHIKIGREYGVSDDDIRAIADETEGRPSTLDRPEQGGAACRPRDDARPVDLGAHVPGAAPEPRQRAPDRPGADHRVLQFGRTYPGHDCRSTSRTSIRNISTSFRCRRIRTSLPDAQISARRPSH